MSRYCIDGRPETVFVQGPSSRVMYNVVHHKALMNGLAYIFR